MEFNKRGIVALDRFDLLPEISNIKLGGVESSNFDCFQDSCNSTSITRMAPFNLIHDKLSARM